jgi:aminopeptidase N
MKVLQLGCLVLAFAWAACATPAKKTESQGQRPTVHASLTMDEASIRARQLKNVGYDLEFDLTQASQSDAFSGKTKIHFELRPGAEDLSEKLSIDFYGGEISKLEINGALISTEEMHRWFNGHQLNIPIEEFKDGSRHVVSLEWQHPYSQDGNGLYRFTDPEDQRVYLYTHLEPYSANKVFPCFDQPDLKASYAVQVKAPESWVVIANTKEGSVTEEEEDAKLWKFPKSPVFSTYIFALIAGDYHQWKSAAGEIPLRLFARKSQRKHVDTASWFKTTRAGLQFFPVQFGIPYPYGKYDQVLVPDLTAGAMENVGAVTFNEKFAYRSQATQEQKRDRDNVILHEMAHMWFGNLVTMKWWNGLWLNESFATFMATWAQAEALKDPEAWKDFFAEKSGAYFADQLVTTHPVETPVGDTEEAFANFDAITYGKGASILKQLFHLIGEDHFREGLQRYFMRFAGRNTSIRDFFQMMSEASGQDLNRWQRTWIQAEGLNHVQVGWECGPDESGKSVITSMQLLQRADSSERPLRKHQTKVALLNKNSGSDRLEASAVFPVVYESSETPIPDALGEPCPRAVFPNYGDEDYAITILDERSLKYLEKELSSIRDPLLRTMIWESLWHEVVEGELQASRFAEMMFRHADQETHPATLSTLLSRMVRRLGRTSVALHLKEKEQAAFFTKLERWSMKQLEAAPAGSDAQIAWFDFVTRSARSKNARRWAKELLDGKRKLEGFALDVERRWLLTGMLARLGDTEATERIAAEKSRDPGDRGEKAAATAEAQSPDLQIKRKWLAEALSEKPQYSVATLKAALRSLWPLEQEELAESELGTYFLGVSALSSRGPDAEELLSTFAWAAMPALCRPQTVDRLQHYLEDEGSSLSVSTKRTLLEGIQSVERCLKARTEPPASEDSLI